MPSKPRIPRLNTNEDELLVVTVSVSVGDEVRAGDVLCTIESTKASADVEAPQSGFVRELGVAAGDRVPVGHPICIITASADEAIDDVARVEPKSGAAVTATVKARALADKHGIDLASLGVIGIVKERDVRRHIDKTTETVRPPHAVSESHGTPRAVVYGASGHARTMIDLVREGYRDIEIVGVVDDAPGSSGEVLGVPILGSSKELERLREDGVEIGILGIGAVTNNRSRSALYERLRAAGLYVPNLIHPRASVEPSVSMGRGNQIFAGAVVGSSARLGNNVIVNSGTVISHDCDLRDHVHVTPGAILAGGVTVGTNSVIGMGVTVYLGVTIGSNVVIANGVHILQDVPDGEIVRHSLHGSPS